MPKKSLFFSILSIVFLISACKETYKPLEGEISMKVEKPVGTSFQYTKGNNTQYFLPYPVNEGTMQIKGKKQKTAVIGKMLESSENVYVIPIARLKYEHDGQMERIILAIPAQNKYRTMEITSYDELITEYYSTKKSLDHWYSNRYGLGSVTDMHWSAY